IARLRFHSDRSSMKAENETAMTAGSTKVVRTMCPMNCHPTFCGMLVDVEVFPFAAQPAKKDAFQALGVQPIGLGTPLHPRHRPARSMNDVGFNAARSQPACQPKAVPAGLECDGNAVDLVPGLLRLYSPAPQEL